MHGDQSDCGYWVKKELSADHPYANQTIIGLPFFRSLHPEEKELN